MLRYAKHHHSQNEMCGISINLNVARIFSLRTQTYSNKFELPGMSRDKESVHFEVK